MPDKLPGAVSDPSHLREFSRVSLAVLDLDGTLLSSHEDSPARASWGVRTRLINRLKSRGVPITLATGRAAAGAAPMIDAVSRHRDTPAIIYNGSVIITASSRVLYSCSIPEHSIQSIKNVAVNSGCSVLFYWIAEDFGGQMTGEWAMYAGVLPKPHYEFNGLTVSDEMDIPLGAICVAALLWIDGASSDSGLLRDLAQIEGISPTASGSKYIEIRPEGSSKARALGVLLSKLNLSPDRVMAIGDNDNDIELLRFAGISVCVSNASHAARVVSRFGADYPSTSGAIQALQVVAHAKRLFPNG